MRLRGRVEGKRVVPYYSRAEVARGAGPVAGKEILWVDDPIEAFFLQIQGSGRIQLEGGEPLRLGYADQNGHPFQSIGRYLVERGELQLSEASMPAIKAWAAANPKRLEELLNQNPSFVFFRELPLADPASGPVGALGVPLAPGRSIADRKSTRLNSSHLVISYAVFCLKKKRTHLHAFLLFSIAKPLRDLLLQSSRHHALS